MINCRNTTVGVAQLVERRIVVPVAEGSNPSTHPIHFSYTGPSVLSLLERGLPGRRVKRDSKRVNLRHENLRDHARVMFGNSPSFGIVRGI